MIKVVDVHKSYTKENETIKGVSFEVREGQIFGLLGPNGAGKTTLMQMIATLMKPTSGQILIDGLSADKNLLDIHRKIGFLTNEIKLDPMSTPNNLFEFFAELYDIPADELRDRRDLSFARFGITPFADKRINELSTGMKQKISIAISLIHNPPVIIFDEPTNGLDILTSKQVTDYLKELKEQGHAIILSTHIFSVAEELCDEIAILVDGRIAAQGTFEQLVAQAQAERAGLDVDQYRENLRLKAEAERGRQITQAYEEQQRRNAMYAQWESEAEELQEAFPNFDLGLEIEHNEEFGRLISNGVSVRNAFLTTHAEDIFAGANAHAETVATQNVLNVIQQRASRPAEGAMRPGAAIVRKSDPSSLSNEDIDEINRRVAMGEAISF